VESILIVVAVLYTIVLVAVVVAMYLRRRKHTPELLYTQEDSDEEWRKVNDIDLGGRRAVRMLTLRDLEAPERRTYQDEWRALQSRSIQDPGRAVVETDRLAERLMETRGFPIRDQLHSAEVPEQHAALVLAYQAGHDIAEAHRRERQSDQQLRQAMAHFRTVFGELLGNTSSQTRNAA